MFKQEKKTTSYYVTPTFSVVFSFWRWKLLQKIFWKTTSRHPKIAQYIKTNMYDWLHDMPQSLENTTYHIEYNICDKCGQEVIISKKVLQIEKSK